MHQAYKFLYGVNVMYSINVVNVLNAASRHHNGGLLKTYSLLRVSCVDLARIRMNAVDT